MKKVIAVLVICMTITSLSVNGQTWTGTISSDWNNNLNWSTGEVPTSNKTVIINNAAAPYQPVLSGDVNIASLTMSAGILGLNGYSLTCSGHATFTGDSLQNGKVAAGTFDNVTNMHMGGKVILEKTGASNEFWEGKNKFYGDSLIIVWRSGALHLENSALSPDSIFGNLKVLLANNYSVYFSLNSPLYIQNDLLLDNTGNGIFFLNGSNNTIIGGNLAAQNFSSSAPNLFFENVTTLGNSANGPFYSHTATVSHCHFNGNFTLVADSTITISIINSSFLGADNLLQAGGLWTHDNQFGRTGPGTTILRAAYNGTDGGVRLRGGNNKCFGNAQWETFALWPGGITIEHTYYGPDTTLGNLSFILTGNASLVTNANGSSYVGGNVIIDGQGAKKSVQFTGGTGTAFTIGGNFTAKNFTPFSVPGIGITNVLLRNVYANGIDTCGTFYCYSGDITNCSFKGNFRLIADSAASYDIANSSFLGTDNLFQALAFNAHDSRFGRLGTGTTILRAANKTTSAVYSRYGNNKYFGNAALETYAAWPGGVIMQQTFFGKDSCLGNLDYILKGNASLVTNESGNSYVGGNVVVDGQGARKWIQFTGGTGITFTIGGNFTVKDFTAFPEPGITNTNVHLRNVYANGSDTCGTFYCYSGDITNCSFKGNFRLIADSAASYDIANSSFLGTDNLFQALAFNAHDSRFGQLGTGSTIFRAANKTTSAVYSRYGNNKYFGNANLETYAAWPGGVIIQQTFFGKDSCFGNLDYTLKGNASLVTNESGNSYVGGNVVVDGQGARKWIQFTGGTGITFTIGGNFTVKNFTASPEPGITNTNVHLRNVYANGSDTCGTFYCTAGDITNSVFNGNLKVIADSANLYYINNTSLLGADNFFRAANLDIQNSVFGKPGTTGTTVFTAAHTLTAVVFVREGNNKFLGNTQFDAYGLLPGGTTIQQTFYGKDTCFGNFAINLSGSSNAYLANGADLYIGKGLLLNNNSTTSGVIHNNAATAIHFIGNDTANYSSTGSGSAPSLLNIEMNRKGGLRLQSPLSCSGNLRFTRGMILSSLANPLIIPNGASVSMAWDSSYADGPVRKTGNSSFIFPVGTNNMYAPVGITAPAFATDEFMAQYFFRLAHNDGYDSTQHDLSLNHLSRAEYWLLNRTAGTSAAKVSLGWKAGRSGAVDVLSDLRVARWNGTSWKDEGNGGTTGTMEEGTIQTLNPISTFSPFTLASSTINNPLPVVYIYFTVSLQPNRTVLLKWETGTETGNVYFEIERSADSRAWSAIATVHSNASHLYSFTDAAPAKGVNYYRIKQVDQDGAWSYTTTRLVRISNDNKIFVWPNPVTDNLYVQVPLTGGLLEIIEAGGRIVQTQVISNTITTIPVQQLANGVYILRVKQGTEAFTEKFIKQ